MTVSAKNIVSQLVKEVLPMSFTKTLCYIFTYFLMSLKRNFFGKKCPKSSKMGIYYGLKGQTIALGKGQCPSPELKVAGRTL